MINRPSNSMYIVCGTKMYSFNSDALVIEEWKHEVQKIEENLKPFEKKYIDRCKELKV